MLNSGRLDFTTPDNGHWLIPRKIYCLIKPEIYTGNVISCMCFCVSVCVHTCILYFMQLKIFKDILLRKFYYGKCARIGVYYIEML